MQFENHGVWDAGDWMVMLVFWVIAIIFSVFS